MATEAAHAQRWTAISSTCPIRRRVFTMICQAAVSIGPRCKLGSAGESIRIRTNARVHKTCDSSRVLPVDRITVWCIHGRQERTQCIHLRCHRRSGWRSIRPNRMQRDGGGESVRRAVPPTWRGPVYLLRSTGDSIGRSVRLRRVLLRALSDVQGALRMCRCRIDHFSPGLGRSSRHRG
jgi:hypothetical protein